MMIIFVSNVCIVCTLNRRNKLNMIRSQQDSIVEVQRKKENKVTRMLVIVTCTFLILLLPFFVSSMYRTSILRQKTNYKTRAISFLVSTICNKLWYTNNAVNFYLYALFGADFRKELGKVFSKKKSVTPSSLEYNTTESSQNTTVF